MGDSDIHAYALSCPILPCPFLSYGAVFSGGVWLQQFYDAADAAHAKDRLDGYNLDGRNISVLYAQVCVDLLSCRCRSCVSLSSLFASADWSESYTGYYLVFCMQPTLSSFFYLLHLLFTAAVEAQTIVLIDIFLRRQLLLTLFHFLLLASKDRKRRQPPAVAFVVLAFVSVRRFFYLRRFPFLLFLVERQEKRKRPEDMVHKERVEGRMGGGRRSRSRSRGYSGYAARRSRSPPPRRRSRSDSR